MIDVRVDTIIYQSQIYYRNLVNTLVTDKSLGKARKERWEKADLILGYLEALNYRDRLTLEEDINNVNHILECLIILCELNQYPTAAPITFQEAPAILVGIKGDTGDTGSTGATGATGLATDFEYIGTAITAIVDSFDVGDAYGARWDYYVQEAGGAQRAGSVVGTWNSDGSSIEMFDTSTPDISSSTTGLEFDVQVSGTDIQLIATITSGTWDIRGSRYFIPNNGNGSGPISDVLANGRIYIGSASGVATAQSVSGVIQITNTGVTSFTSTAANSIISIINSSSSTTINLSNIAPVTADRVLISSPSGVITPSSVTVTTLGYLDATSSIQTQLDTKLTDPTTTIGDLIIRNGSNNIARLGIGTAGQVLTVSGGVPVWDNVPGVTTTGGVSLQTKIVAIGDWNMDSTANILVAHGLADYKSIRSVDVIIRDDADSQYLPLAIPSGLLGGYYIFNFAGLNPTTIQLNRISGGFFDNTSYDSTSYNRGWITITYEI